MEAYVIVHRPHTKSGNKMKRKKKILQYQHGCVNGVNLFENISKLEHMYNVISFPTKFYITCQIRDIFSSSSSTQYNPSPTLLFEQIFNMS